MIKLFLVSFKFSCVMKKLFFSGIGIKGPQGPPGPSGIKGPLGSQGKASRHF